MRELDPQIRQLFRKSLRAYAFNCDLSEELGRLVIRHCAARRRTGSSAVGEEFLYEERVTADCPDRHVLHTAPGLDVRGDRELPHLLREQAAPSAGKGERVLSGTTPTGCCSILLESVEGRSLSNALRPHPWGGPISSC